MKLPKLNLKSLAFLSYGPQVRPARDWLVLISIALVLFLASAGWNAWLFYRVIGGETLEAAAPSSSSAFTTDSITKAEALFDERAAEAARYRSEYKFIDPSL